MTADSNAERQEWEAQDRDVFNGDELICEAYSPERAAEIVRDHSASIAEGKKIERLRKALEGSPCTCNSEGTFTCNRCLALRGDKEASK